MKPLEWEVIVVEDLYDDQQLISLILMHNGIQVHVARNGQECLELLETVNPTMIITDLSMPVKDGWQTLVALRSQVKTAHIPVIAVTAFHSADVARDAVNAGFDAYFPKPINPNTFVQRLDAVLQS